MEICKELHIPVEEKQVTPQELKGSDAAFFCGTAAEIIGWESLDDIPFKKFWNDSIGKKIQQAYKDRVIEKEYNSTLQEA